MISVESLKGWVKTHWVRLALVVGYALIILPFYLLPHLVPDEKDFFFFASQYNHRIVSSDSFMGVFQVVNLLGYGAIYWYLYTLFVSLSETAWLWMRLVSWVCMVSIPIAVWRLGDVMKSKWTTWTMGLWCLFPMAWWVGKLSGPEPLSLGAMMWAVFYFFRGKKWDFLKSGVALGVGVAIKLSNVPLALFLGIIGSAGVFSKRYTLKQAGWWVFGGLLGGALAMPSFFVRPQVYVQMIQKYGASIPFDITRLPHILFTTNYTWDRIATFGVLNVGILWFTLPIWLWLLVKGRVERPVLISLGVTFLAFLLLVITRQHFLGWYAICLLPIFLSMTLMISWESPRAKQLMIALLIGQSMFTVPHLISNYREKIEANLIYKDRYKIAVTVVRWLADKQVDVVVDWSEFLFMLPYNKFFHPVAKPKLYDVYYAQKWFANPDLPTEEKWFDHPVLLPHEGAVVLIGKRLIRGRPFEDVAGYLVQKYPNRKIQKLQMPRVTGYYLYPEK